MISFTYVVESQPEVIHPSDGPFDCFYSVLVKYENVRGYYPEKCNLDRIETTPFGGKRCTHLVEFWYVPGLNKLVYPRSTVRLVTANEIRRIRRIYRTEQASLNVHYF